MAAKTRPRALRVLRSDPLPPLPSVQDLLDAEIPRRPGELHEALPLPGDAAMRIATRAAQAGVAVDIAASLSLEAGLLDLRLPRLRTLDGRRVPPPGLPLPQASARYLRSLSVGRRPSRAPASPPHSVAIPVRLVARLGGADVEQLIDLVALEQAIAWEIAAIRAGQTMSEWVLERLLLEC
jgi:hypothetical protein